MPFYCFRLLLAVLFMVIKITAADPDPVQDFCVADTSSSTIFMNGLPCLNPTTVTGKHFVTSVLGSALNPSGTPVGFSATIIGAQDLPSINTVGLTMVRTDMAVGGVVPPHAHPRADEIVFVVKGRLNAGFVDTSNKLFSADMKAGDVFVYPRGTVHYLQNIGSTPAFIIGAFNSQNPGVIKVAATIFAANPAIPKGVLSKAFNITFQEVEKIREGLSGS